MAKRAVPGLSKSKGMSRDFPVFPDGKYVLRTERYTEKESSKGTSTIHNFMFRCVEALGDEPAQKEMEDKVYFHRLIEMHEDHASFEEYGHIFVDELKSMCDAFGVKVTKSDNIDFEDFVAQAAIATIRMVDGQDATGQPRKENTVYNWEADEV